MSNTRDTEIEISALKKRITELESAEKELKEELHKCRGVFENAIEGIFQIDADGRPFNVNPAAAAMMGYDSPEDFKSSITNIAAVYQFPEERENVLAILSKNRFLRNHEIRNIRKDGQIIWVSANARMVYDEDGNAIYHEGTVQDISERKKMEEELTMHRDHLGKLVAERTHDMNQEMIRRKEKEEQYLALVESIVEWVWETDENFAHTYVSPRISEYLGYEPEEFLGKTPYDFMSPDMIPALKRLMVRRKPFSSLQIPAVHKNGAIVLIEGNGKPYFDKSGKFKGYRGSCRDIAEQQRTMDMLQENERQLVAQSETLKETNAALRVLLKQREDDKRELEEMFISNIKEMVIPYLNKMQKDRIDVRHKAYLDIITANLNEIMAPFLNKVRQLNFTPKEIEVASLIKDGKTTKEIAEIMGVAASAIDSHRNNIRTKLGLINKGTNLRSYLLTVK